jgi:uncharacterized membrane protein YvlD (DUF360 family)
MIRFLINAAIYLGSAALALWVTSLILDGFDITLAGLLISAAIFALIQSLLGPFIFKMTTKYANAFTGGIGLLTAFVALLITDLLRTGLSIDGVSTWVAATAIVWLITAIATFVLPMIFLKKADNSKEA